MKHLTSRQQAVLDFVKLRIEQQHGPTLEEIAKQFEITKQAAAHRVNAIIKKGFMMRREGEARGLVPLEPGRRCAACGSVVKSTAGIEHEGSR